MKVSLSDEAFVRTRLTTAIVTSKPPGTIEME